MPFYHITSQETLEKLALHCPRAIAVFLQCVNRCDEKGNFFFTKRFVTEELSYSWVKFRADLKSLYLEGILEWHPFKEGISVTLNEEALGGEDD